MLMFGGIKTPFVLSATFRGDGDIDTVLTKEFDTFGEARSALEDLILSNEDFVHDYSIDFQRSDLMGGDIVKFDFVTVSDPDRPDRKPVTRSHRIAKGVWSIGWRKPEPAPQEVLDEIAREEVRAREAAGIA